MRRIYYLDTCKTCERIIKELGNLQTFEFQNIKTQPLTEEQLNFLYSKVGSYEELFSRKAMKYRSMGLDKIILGEADYQRLILEEYTFLKRPVIVIDEEVFIGSTQKNVEAAKSKLVSTQLS